MLICSLLFVTGTVSALPDLTITSILMPDATGPSVSWSVTVTNQGDETTSSAIFLRLSIVNPGFIQDFITIGQSAALIVHVRFQKPRQPVGGHRQLYTLRWARGREA